MSHREHYDYDEDDSRRIKSFMRSGFFIIFALGVFYMGYEAFQEKSYTLSTFLVVLGIICTFHGINPLRKLLGYMYGIIFLILGLFSYLMYTWEHDIFDLVLVSNFIILALLSFPQTVFFIGRILHLKMNTANKFIIFMISGTIIGMLIMFIFMPK